MTQRVFMDMLKKHLYFGLTSYELNEVLKDYENYFEELRQDGKTDDEIIHLLGKPRSIATDILSEVNKSRINISHLGRRFLMISILLLSVFIVIISYNELFLILDDRIVSAFFLILLPLAIVIILGGRKLLNQKATYGGIYYFYLLNLIVIIFSHIIKHIMIGYIKVQTPQTPMIVNFTIILTVVVFLSLMFVSSILTSKKTFCYIPLLCANSACVLTVYYYKSALTFLSSIESFISHVARINQIEILGIITFIITLLVIFILRGIKHD